MPLLDRIRVEHADGDKEQPTGDTDEFENKPVQQMDKKETIETEERSQTLPRSTQFRV